MNEPPDINGGDLGSDLNPPVGSYVCISNKNDGTGSEMDTDGSISKTNEISRKRIRQNKICRHCNKPRKRSKRKLNGDTEITDFTCENECNCTSINEKPDLSQETFKSPSTFNITSPHTVSQPQQASTDATSNPAPSTNESSSPAAAQVGRREYVSSDSSPYLVHVQKITNAPNDGTILHPITFGNFLKKNNFKNIVSGSVKRIGRNRCAVSFSTYNDANDFVNNSQLALHKFKAFIPTFNVTRMGLIRGVPSDWSLEEIQQNMTTPIGCGEIIKIRRLNYKVNVNGTSTWKPSQSIVVTFDGQVLPKRVFMCYNSLPVEIYTYPTIQCYQCCRYGHTKSLCRSAPRCYKCGQNHTAESCQIEEDAASCIMCSGFHYATSKTCPEFNRQKQIKTSMAHSCISYAEACQVHPPVSKSYADVLVSTPSQFSSHPQNSPSSPLGHTTSHKKTVFSKPRSPPKTVKGYDRAAHNALIKELQGPTPANGCAFASNKSTEPESQHTEIIDIIMNLLNLLLQNKTKPPNAAIINNVINKSTYDGYTNYPVEQQEHLVEKE